MSTRDVATRLLLMKVLRDMVDAEVTAARKAAHRTFDVPGVRDIGLVGTEQIGSVQLAHGPKSAGVTDEAKLLAWAKQHMPETVETVTVTTERVKPAVLGRWLAAARSPHAAISNKTTGEMVLPDGITIKEGGHQLRVIPAKDAAETVQRAVEAGTLDLATVLGPLAIGGAS